MRKFIKNLLLFAITILIIYPFIIWGIGSIFYKGTNTIVTQSNDVSVYEKKISEITHHEPVDVLIIGSSHAFRGFDTRSFEQIGLKTYNLGTSAQSPINSNYLLKKYLPIFKPKFIIWEMYPRMFSVDGVAQSIIQLINDSITTSMIFESLKSKNIQSINTSIYHFVNQKIKGFELTRKKIKYPQIAGGYFEHIDTVFKHIPIEIHQIEINKLQMKAFNESIEEIKKNNAQVILVEAPVSKYYNSKIKNRDDFTEKFKHFKHYYIYNDMKSLSDSVHFYDFGHLNSKGVKIFNNQLLNDLQRDGVFK